MIATVRGARKLRGEVRLPGDKSISHRALILGALADGTSSVRGLSQGEDVFIAGEGEIVDRRYRILRISPMSVEVEDVLNNNHQSIPLTQG